MSLIKELQKLYTDSNEPCFLSRTSQLRPTDILQADTLVEQEVVPGDVVALIGDFDSVSIRQLITIIDKKAILVPLSASTRSQHEYFFEAANVNVVIDGNTVKRIKRQSVSDKVVKLRTLGHAGLVLFSSGTTGMPKAILHDFEKFLARFRTPRPTFRTLNFLLFDHIGGINTLFHTLFNKGTVVIPTSRQVSDIVADMLDFNVELLPTTPTFLRMALISGILETTRIPSLKVITYGTERMDEPSLERLCRQLPSVAFRQTYGMSELGILRVKSEANNSLWMKIGGEGVTTKVVDGVLNIKSESRMIGYLNAPSPFDDEGWYNTKDLVDSREDGHVRIIGRNTDWINIGGEKVLPGVIEKAALEHPQIMHVKAEGVDNPITGQHIELTCQFVENQNPGRRELKKWLMERLPAAFMPQRIKEGTINVSHRFKKL